MNFSLRLKELREEKGFSQAQLARVLSVGVGSVGMWESTDRIPPAKKLSRIADYFEVTTDYLLGRSNVREGKVEFTALSALPAKEEEVLRNFRKLSPALQDVAIETVRVLAGVDSKNGLQKKA